MVIKGLTKLIKSPLRYPGGKSRLVEEILARFPEDFDNSWEFREPFVGGGSVFITVRQLYPECKVWINDKNTELINFWTKVRDNLPDLVKEIRLIKEEYAGKGGRQLYKFLINCENLDPAVRFFCLNRITFSGTTKSGGYSEQAFRERFTDSSIDRLELMKGLLDGVVITNYDFLLPMLSETKKSDCLIFLDPPYLTAEQHGLYGKNGNLHKGFSHIALCAAVKRTEHLILMTYDGCQEIKDMYHLFNQEDFSLLYSMRNNEHGEEVFITNY